VVITTNPESIPLAGEFTQVKNVMTPSSSSIGNLRHYGAALVICLGLSSHLMAANLGPSLNLSVSPPGISNEFSATSVLDWTGVPGATYVVQATTNLADPDSWTAVDMAQSDTGPIRWMAPESLRGQTFYRLITQPLISDLQPAFIDSGDTNAVLYILGQLLPTNATVVINGHNFSLQHDADGAMFVSLNGLPPGEPIKS
jgi:hypothetical protein